MITLASIAGITLAFAWFAWQRRWISDDGLIFVRIVNQILDGNGPVFNAFERAEANTSALWPWLLALVGGITRARIALVAVGTGFVLSIAGVAVALDATRRWHRTRGEQSALVPLGAMVLLAVPPFWDYATSGLETGLTTCWLAVTWWLFVAVAGGDPTPRRQLVSALVFGLGPLVRPDLGVVSIGFLAGSWWLLRPSRRRTLVLAAAALALPVAYEVFRAGYYGVLVPLPALAKGATGSEWSRGIAYLVDFVKPSWLWLPGLAFAALLVLAIVRRSIGRRDRILVVVPVVTACVMGLYVVRVGGDFMHGRMWLPATFLALMPGLLVPLRRIAIPAVIVTLVWGVVVEQRMTARRVRTTSWFVEDERVGYVWFTKHAHPISDAIYIKAGEPTSSHVAELVRDRKRTLITEGGANYALADHVPATLAYVAGRLGTGGVIAPTDGIVVDTLGLANPIGARIEVNRPDESAGHQKSLPWAWVLADFADLTQAFELSIDVDELRAAAHAMTCGDLAELVASTREPLTLSRFAANLVGSIRRTRLEIPSDPFDAEAKFCGVQPPHTRVRTSSVCEVYGWAKRFAIDGIKQYDNGRQGYSSQIWITENHTEWVAIEYAAPRTVSAVVLHPRSDPGNVGVGFPIDFSIQTWDGHTWVDRVTKTAFPRPDGPRSFAFAAPVTTSKIRIVGTNLPSVVGEGYVMQFAEIEVL